MSLHALFVLLVVGLSFFFSFYRHPFWGVLGYVFLYFNLPDPHLNWWASELPDLRWSLLAAGVVIFSMLLHSSKLNQVYLTKFPNFRYLVFFFIVALIITPFSVSIPVSLQRNYDFFRYLICFIFITKCIPDLSKFEILIWVLLLCCFNLSFEAYIHPEYRHGGRLEGLGTPDSTDANLFATVLLISVPFLLNKVLFGSKLQQGAAFLLSVFILNGIVLCNSRGSLVGLTSIALVYFAFSRGTRVRAKLIVGALLGALLFIKLMDPTFIERILPSKGIQDTSGSGRMEIWSYGLDMVKDYPFGAGGGGFQILSPYYMPPTLLTEGIRSSHNTYLQILVEQGLVGLFLFLLFCLSTVRMLHEIRKNTMSSSHRLDEDRVQSFFVNSLAVEAAFVGVLISGFFVDRLYFEILYWLAALAAILYFLEMNIRLLPSELLHFDTKK